MAGRHRYSSVLAIILVLLSSTSVSNAAGTEAGDSQKSGGWFQWWYSQPDTREQQERYEGAIDRLKKLYKRNVQPLEEMYDFTAFYNSSMILDDSYFDAKPMVLLLGDFSTGKSTFVQHLLQSDFPGLQISPEPTTDVFMAVMHSEQERLFPGSVAALDKANNFGGLKQFGRVFMHEHFKASTLPNPVLRSITLVDTPGIQAGREKSMGRGYDFEGVCSWFAEEADMIILFFDVNKLTISDELKRVIESIQKHHRKLFVVLNKADTTTTPELIRVYGGLMWGLGKTINRPEVTRVYIGSFWDEPFKHDENRKLFEKHREELIGAIQAVSRTDITHKVDKMLKRAHMVKVHAHILGHLRSEMPTYFRFKNTQDELIKNLGREFQRIQMKYKLVAWDFPDVGEMQELLRKYDFSQFVHPDDAKDQISAVNSMLSDGMADIASMEGIYKGNRIKGGVFEECSDHCHEQ